MDGILMLTFYNQERAHGFAPVDAMFRSASTRMRPLLMTALSACIGLLPRSNFHGYRQPGATSPRHGDRGRHAGRPHYAASSGPRAANDIPGRP